ncbi:putative membrane protein [Yarrowia sp. C11]|nr:putative membrane protein [Yarrowia sp. E02]KAG5373203.1 putative membrane protein [Yarrowia sp. C11]
MDTHGITDTVDELTRQNLESDECQPLLPPEETCDEESDCPDSILKPKYAKMPYSKRPSPTVLIIAFAIYATAIIAWSLMSINVLINLVCQREYGSESSAGQGLVSFLAAPIVENPTLCQTPLVQKKTARFQIVMETVQSLVAMITVTRLGELSDRIGRKPLLLWCGVCTVLNALIWLPCVLFGWHYHTLVAGSFFMGLSGSVPMLMAMNHSYATDVVRSKHRAKVFGYMHGAIFAGAALGPFSVGRIAKNWGIIAAMGFSLSLQMVFLGLVFFLVPESRSKLKRKYSTHFKRVNSRSGLAGPSGGNNGVFSHPSSSRDPTKNTVRVSIVEEARGESTTSTTDTTAHKSRFAKSVTAVKEHFEALSILSFSNRSKSTRINAWIILSIDAFMYCSQVGVVGLLVLYSGFRFKWGTEQTGNMISIMGLSKVLAVMLFMPVVMSILNRVFVTRLNHIDMTDLFVIRLGMIVNCLGWLGVATATSGPLFLVAVASMSLSSTASPTLQSALVKYIDRKDTGRLLGALALLHHICSLLAPIVFTSIYTLTVDTRPEICFYIVSVIFAVMFTATMFISHPSDDE